MDKFIQDALANPEVMILIQVAISMALGGLLGIEREAADKPAGLRTHIMVSSASTLFIALGMVAVSEFSGIFPNEVIKSDPIRVLQAIITGVSFLGAGTIIHERSKGAIEGLTTAASVFLASGVGISVGFERWILAGGTTLLALIALRGLPRLSKRKPRA